MSDSHDRTWSSSQVNVLFIFFSYCWSSTVLNSPLDWTGPLQQTLDFLEFWKKLVGRREKVRQLKPDAVNVSLSLSLNIAKERRSRREWRALQKFSFFLFCSFHLFIEKGECVQVRISIHVNRVRNIIPVNLMVRRGFRKKERERESKGRKKRERIKSSRLTTFITTQNFCFRPFSFCVTHLAFFLSLSPSLYRILSDECSILDSKLSRWKLPLDHRDSHFPSKIFSSLSTPCELCCIFCVNHDCR